MYFLNLCSVSTLLTDPARFRVAALRVLPRPLAELAAVPGSWVVAAPRSHVSTVAARGAALAPGGPAAPVAIHRSYEGWGGEGD